VDSNDRIIVSDSGNDRVVVFDSSGNFLLRFGSPGTSDGQFNGAQMLTVDSNDRIIVPDLTNQDVQDSLMPLKVPLVVEVVINIKQHQHQVLIGQLTDRL